MFSRFLSIALFVSLSLAPSGSVRASSPALAQEPAQKSAPAHAFDANADARTEVTRALETAARKNKRVLIAWGADGSPAAEALAMLLAKDKDLVHAMLYEFVLVRVEAPRNPAARDLATAYGADIGENALPFLTIVDAKGKALDNQRAANFTKTADPTSFDPAALLANLVKFQATPLVADELLQSARTRARSENKRIFLHFGAPWCGWCRKLESWMASPAIAPLLAKDFIDLEIDVERMRGGLELMTRYAGEKKMGVPWIVLVDADAKALADSNGPSGNIGFPVEAAEIEHFRSMLVKARVQLTDAEIATMVASLAKKPDAPAGH